MTAIARLQREAERAPAGVKPRRVPRKIQRAAELIQSGECTTITAAAARAGVSREYLSKAFSLPHVRLWLSHKIRRAVAVASLRASSRLGELVDSQSEHVSLDASRLALAIEGVKPPEGPAITNNINIIPGYDYVFSSVVPPTKTIEHDPPTSD